MALDRESRRGFVVSVVLYALAAGAVLLTGAQRHPWVVVLAAGLLLAAAARGRHDRAPGAPAAPAAHVAAHAGAARAHRGGGRASRSSSSGPGRPTASGCSASSARSSPLGHLVGELRSWTAPAAGRRAGLLVLVGDRGRRRGIWVGTTNPTGLYVALAPCSSDRSPSPCSPRRCSRRTGCAVVVGGRRRSRADGGRRLAVGAIGVVLRAVVAVVVLVLLVLAIAADTPGRRRAGGHAGRSGLERLSRAPCRSTPTWWRPRCPVSTVSAGDRVLVSLGDSYMSGEGAQSSTTAPTPPAGTAPTSADARRRRTPT